MSDHENMFLIINLPHEMFLKELFALQFIRKDTKEHYESHKDQHMALILQQLSELKQDGHQTKEDLDQTKTETLKTIMQLSATKKELSLTIQKLKETTEDALQTKEELLKTKAQLNSTKIEFLKTQELLSLTIQKLKETTEDALQTKEELLKTKEQLNLTKIQLSITEEKLYETEFQLDRNAESEERAKETVTDEAESLGIEIEDEESAVEILSNIVKTNRAYRVNEFKRMLSITAGLRKENKRYFQGSFCFGFVCSNFILIDLHVFFYKKPVYKKL